MQEYVAYIRTAAGAYVELEFCVASAGEARYLAKRAQRGGEVIDVFERRRLTPAGEAE